MSRLARTNRDVFFFKEGSCYVKRKVETSKTKDGFGTMHGIGF